MSRRRGAAGGGQGITGPQSALTNFLAAHNISAAQIRSDYEARQAAAEQTQAGPSNAPAEDEEDNAMEVDEEAAEEVERLERQSKKRKRDTERAIAKIKKSKEFAKKKAMLRGEPGEDDDDGLALDMWQKSKIIPGQMENCEECSKRFTVTPYTKEGPNGGLLCAKCGKIQEDAKKKDAKAKAKAKQAPVSRGKKNKAQSNQMEGYGAHGSKSLLETCVEQVAKSIVDIEDFGDLPPQLYNRLSMILSKHRVLDSRTLDLFLQSDNDRLAVYDCGKLQTDDFIRIFQICPNIEKIDLRNAGQFKDRVLDFVMERKIPIRELRLNASNLITDAKWQQFFGEIGPQLESVQLSWLDFAMTNPSLEALVTNCTRLRRLKLKQCFHLDDDSLGLLHYLQNLEHLSLTFTNATSPNALTALVYAVGRNLETLCLRDFTDANDTLIEAIAVTCSKLKKLVITNNDRITDGAYTQLFQSWLQMPFGSRPMLERAIFNSSRDTESETARIAAEDGKKTENNDDDGPVGFSSHAFKALFDLSGSVLQKLSLASCRSISHEALLEVFGSSKTYPQLAELDVSFVSGVDTAIIAGIFKSCPKLVKLVAFGCFDIEGVTIPRGVALIGVPAAQEGIVQEGEEEMDYDY